MNVVAEVLDDVLSEARAIRREEGDADRAWIDRFHDFWRNAESNRFPAGRAGGGDPRRLPQNLRKEKGIPGAPGVELRTVDLEVVLHLPDCKTPEARHPLRLVAVNATPITENALRFFGLDAGIFRDLGQ